MLFPLNNALNLRVFRPFIRSVQNFSVCNKNFFEEKKGNIKIEKKMEEFSKTNPFFSKYEEKLKMVYK